MSLCPVNADAESILHVLLAGDVALIPLPDQHAAENLKKSLGKRYQRLKKSLEAVYYDARPKDSDLPYHDGGLSKKTIGYSKDKNGNQYRFELRDKRSDGQFARRCYLVTAVELNQSRN